MTPFAAATANRIATMTTVRGAAIRTLKEKTLEVKSLQEHHARPGYCVPRTGSPERNRPSPFQFVCPEPASQLC